MEFVHFSAAHLATAAIRLDVEKAVWSERI
jgi:hypothetical protein